LHFLHRGQQCPLEHFDVTLPGNVRFGVAQNALNDFIVRAQCEQVRRNSATKPVPPYHGNPMAAIAGRITF